MKIKFTLNNNICETEIQIGQTLFEFLRGNDIKSVKYGCDDGKCGACTIIIDGITQNSCMILMHSLDGKVIETVESFEENELLKDLQDRFLDKGAVQCGYCTPGMLLSADALLREGSNTSEEDIKDALAGNLCRCTGYVKPIKAVKK